MSTDHSHVDLIHSC